MNYLASALAYAQYGWAIFPLSPGQKVPPKGSRGVLDATTDINVVRGWWSNGPDYNIGLACGARSGLYVLDIDPRHGGDTAIKALQEQHGQLPETVVVGTGGGGFQFYFRHSNGLRNTANKLGVGLDTRGDGGYVVAPPSLHPSGKHYQFYKGRGFADLVGGALALADVPGWIVAATAVAGGRGGRAVARPDKFRQLFAEGAGSGSRNDSLARMAGYLFRIRKLDAALARDILRLWNDARIVPPLTADEVERTINSVAGKELARMQRRAHHG